MLLVPHLNLNLVADDADVWNTDAGLEWVFSAIDIGIFDCIKIKDNFFFEVPIFNLREQVGQYHQFILLICYVNLCFDSLEHHFVATFFVVAQNHIKLLSLDLLRLCQIALSDFKIQIRISMVIDLFLVLRRSLTHRISQIRWIIILLLFILILELDFFLFL